MKTTTNLSGRALAEAAARVMGWEWEQRHAYPHWRRTLYGGQETVPGDWSPSLAASADYLCLEWARENWGDKSEPMVMCWRKFAGALGAAWDYVPGDYARALLAAAGEGER